MSSLLEGAACSTACAAVVLAVLRVEAPSLCCMHVQPNEREQCVFLVDGAWVYKVFLRLAPSVQALSDNCWMTCRLDSFCQSGCVFIQHASMLCAELV